MNVIAWLLCFLLFAPGAVLAHANHDDLAFEPRMRAAVPTALVFHDEAGHAMRWEEAAGAKPVVLVLGYAACRDLCPVTLVGVAEALRHTRLRAGRDYVGIFASIDPHDDARALARTKDLRLPADERAGWHFLQGTGDAVPQLARTVGFRYRAESDGEGYAHPAGFVVLTPDARVARYFEGVRFDARALEDAVADAARGREATLGERLRLLCSHLDPTTGRHTATVLLVLRGVVVAGVWGLAFFLWRARRRVRTP